jgi:hypothetical protein
VNSVRQTPAVTLESFKLPHGCRPGHPYTRLGQRHAADVGETDRWRMAAVHGDDGLCDYREIGKFEGDSIRLE